METLSLVAPMLHGDERPLDAFDHESAIERFGKKTDGTLGLSLLTDMLAGKGSDQDDRHTIADGGEMALQVEAAHARHLHVGDQAGGDATRRRGKELLGRAEGR